MLYDRKKFTHIHKATILTNQDLQNAPNTLFFNLSDESTMSVWFWIEEFNCVSSRKIIKRNEGNKRIFDVFKIPIQSPSSNQELANNLIELITAGTMNAYDFAVDKKITLDKNELKHTLLLKLKAPLN